MNDYLRINPEKETRRIIKFMRAIMENESFDRVVLGLSGGIDSTVSLFLALKAFGSGKVICALLPFCGLDAGGEHKTLKVLEKIEVPSDNIIKVEINRAVEAISEYDNKFDRLRLGNIMARVRMVYLFDLAKKYKALVLGTENRTEHELGYFTRFGDEASDIEPIRHLYKTQVRQLADYLGIPSEIIKKPPTAGLWEDQTDEKELGFSYGEADKVLFLKFEKKFDVKKTVFISGVALGKVTKILKRTKENSFKKNNPYIIGAK